MLHLVQSHSTHRISKTFNKNFLNFEGQKSPRKKKWHFLRKSLHNGRNIVRNLTEWRNFEFWGSDISQNAEMTFSPRISKNIIRVIGMKKLRISVHLSVQPQNWAVLQYISQYICYISTRSTYQYKSVRVATLSATSRFWHIVSMSLHSFWGLTDWLTYFAASREVITLKHKPNKIRRYTNQTNNKTHTSTELNHECKCVIRSCTG